MSLVIDTLRASTLSDGLGDAEVEILAELFEVNDYKDGEVVISPEDPRTGNLCVLAQGHIEVRVLAGEEESTVYVLNPGDLTAMITFVGGAASQISATLYAAGDTRVLSLAQSQFENLVNTHPMIVYRVMQGVARQVHGIVRRVNQQSAELCNYVCHAGIHY